MNSHKPSFHVNGHSLLICGTRLENYKIVDEIGSGENGVVYHAINTLLNRDEALKVWRGRKTRDGRDKAKQGLLEAQKLARVSPEHAVVIYSAQEINGVFLATMEFIKGQTLAWHKKIPTPISDVNSLKFT